MNMGFIEIDCGGIDLTKTTKQTVTGIYDRCVEAMESGKIIIATNCYYGSAEVTPIHVFIVRNTATKLCATASVLQVFIESNDKVQVSSMISA